MKATITKISDGKVWAKSVNPLGEKKPRKRNFMGSGMLEKKLSEWQQAESERLELELHEDCYTSELWNDDHITFTRNNFQLFDGVELEVTREGNYFKII